MRSSLQSCKWISVFIFVLLGYFAITPNVTAQVSVDCSSQTISGVDCPDPEELNEDNNEEDGVNIEEQIPSVIPSP
jgi:hypothetical protein